MNIPTILTIFACTVVLLKLLGYITLAWSAIFLGVGVLFGGMFILMLLAAIVMKRSTDNFLQKRNFR
ncbi:MAG: hypothetical protein EKK57_07870 [Proteobacteria bacterium]|nr:MAG: hypothetical protein EKK57_07870 [Pseudomonadota bacterium]